MMEVELNKELYDKKLSVLSFIAMFGVMLIHSGTIEDYSLLYEFGLINGIAGSIELTITDLAISANAFFFMSAAYHFYFGLTESKILPKLHRRLYTLLIPYIIAITASIGYYWLIYIIPGLTEKVAMEKPDMSFLRLLGEYINPKFNYPLWFMKYLMIYACLGIVILKIFRFRHIAKLIIGTLIVLDVFGLIKNYYITWGTVYLVGGYVGFYSKNIENGLSCRIFNKYKNLDIAILAFSAFIFLIIDRDEYFYTVYLNAYKYCSPFMLWALSNRMLRFAATLQKYWWSHITFIVYSYHVLLLPVLMKILYMLLPKNAIIGITAYILGPVLTFVIIVIVAMVVRKNTVCWKLLTGGRG